MNTGVRKEAENELPDVTEPGYGFETIGKELAWRRLAAESTRKHIENLERYARRIEPVCRNCIHAGPLTYTGNYPYRNDWGSCLKDAPIAGPVERLGAWDAHTHANSARWPSVAHTATCGAFKLRPMITLPPTDISSSEVVWAWQDTPPPADKGQEE